MFYWIQVRWLAGHSSSFTFFTWNQLRVSLAVFGIIVLLKCPPLFHSSSWYCRCGTEPANINFTDKGQDSRNDHVTSHHSHMVIITVWVICELIVNSKCEQVERRQFKYQSTGGIYFRFLNTITVLSHYELMSARPANRFSVIRTFSNIHWLPDTALDEINWNKRRH